MPSDARPPLDSAHNEDRILITDRIQAPGVSNDDAASAGGVRDRVETARAMRAGGVASPRAKGTHALTALMAQLHDIQPTPTHSDYVAAAQDLLRAHRQRALIVVITNFRDEDSTELRHALRLLRSRHLVLPASLREWIVGGLRAQAPGAS